MEASITKNNISNIERAILEGYRKQDNSIYKRFEQSPFWNLTHYRILNFSAELNCTFIRCLDGESNSCCVSFSLRQVQDGLNGSRLSAELTDNIAHRLHLKDSNFTTIVSEVSRLMPDQIFPMPLFALARLGPDEPLFKSGHGKKTQVIFTFVLKQR